MKQATFRIYIVASVFILAISFPLINSNAHLLKDVESFENRALAKKPEFNINHLDPFPALYDTFYTDNFELRNTLIRDFNIYKVQAFRKSPVKSVVIGADNWLYISGDEMDSYMGKNRLTQTELKDFKLELEYRKKYLATRGIKFYFLVIPCKASIHTEHIGYEYFRMHNDSWGQQLNNYLAKNSNVKVIDVFDSLKKYKKDENLYYKLDNHWNDLGAFYTANEVFKIMQKDFPAIKPLSIEDFYIKTEEHPADNLDKMLGKLGVFSEQAIELNPKKGFKAKDGKTFGYPPVPGFVYPWDFEKVKEIKDSDKPKLLIISDSFGKNIFPFISENFSRTVKIFDSWQYKLNEDIVNSEKPDAVIVMINEPVLRAFLNHSSRPH